MKLDIAGIRNEVGANRPFSFQTDVVALDYGQDWIHGSIVGTGNLVNLGPCILVQGALECEGHFSCSRCLRPTVQPFKIDFELEIEPSTLTTEEWIDITETIRDAMILSEPMKPLCGEFCKGLCPSCGKDLNEGSCSCERDQIDPRLRKLAILLQGKETDLKF